MKIAIVCHASAGGSGVVATELALALAQKGHGVHLVAATRPFRLTEERLVTAKQQFSGPLAFMQRWFRGGARPNLQFHPVLEAEYPLFSEPLSPITVANTLVQVVAEHGVDLIHAHYAIPHALSAVLAREMSDKPVKVLTTMHGTDISLVGLEPALKASTRYSLERSDSLSAVSAALAQDTHELMGVNKPVQVIPNWVDPKRFKPNKSQAFRSRFAAPEEALLLYISNFRPVKAPQDAVRVFARVLEEQPARMIMVGQGPEREKCIELAMQLRVDGHIHFLEFTQEVERLMGVADLLLLPSEMESFGLVALEAMACGIPVVASRVGGLPEVVVDGQTGRLCTPGDVKGMAEAALEILTNPYTQFQMGEAAHERAISEFSPEKVLPRYVELYRQTLAQA